jgi:hypothetical protein
MHDGRVEVEFTNWDGHSRNSDATQKADLALSHTVYAKRPADTRMQCRHTYI